MILIIIGLTGGFLLRGLWVKEKEEGIKIIGVIDGDTIVTENKVRVRLRYVDAPELEFCGGKESKELLESLVLNQRVKVVDQIIDQMGRPLALIYWGDKLVNKIILQEGWAKYHSDMTNLTQDIKKAANEAREKKIGIFGEKCSQLENKEKPKCKIKGNIDPSNSSVRIYQMEGCVQYATTTVDLYRGEQWFCSEAEAKKAGFVKSKRCN